MHRGRIEVHRLFTGKPHTRRRFSLSSDATMSRKWLNFSIHLIAGNGPVPMQSRHSRAGGGRLTIAAARLLANDTIQAEGQSIPVRAPVGRRHISTGRPRPIHFTSETTHKTSTTFLAPKKVSNRKPGFLASSIGRSVRTIAAPNLLPWAIRCGRLSHGRLQSHQITGS